MSLFAVLYVTDQRPDDRIGTTRLECDTGAGYYLGMKSAHVFMDS
ncbi:hypothetical protein [Fimbriiglobus ruber]|nr:hypothetical protein [Fimbriiglobus ruber]